MVMIMNWEDFCSSLSDGIRFRIMNNITGAYIHRTMSEILEFNSYSAVYMYLKQYNLNEKIYEIKSFERSRKDNKAK